MAYILNMENKIFRFNYPLTPGNASRLRRLDELVFLLYAKGTLGLGSISHTEFLNAEYRISLYFLGSVSGSPNQHSGSGSGRGSTSELVNVTTTFESETKSPSQLKKKVHGMYLIQ
jgi:hypothetical protein